jgi:hypothetical protein
MQVPVISWRGDRRELARGRRRGSCVGWVGMGLVALGFLVWRPQEAMAGEKKSGPWLQLSLSSLGFPGVSNPFLSSGSSMLTIHFLDGKHLLVTYSLRTLVPRLEGDPVDHDDRLVAGEVVDLPSGHISARTEWHMHDHGRYLWKLGNGRFLVRIGERLYTIAPMANMASRDPFVRTVFPGRPVRPSVVLVSPDDAVVTLETVVEEPQASKTQVVLGDPDTEDGSASKTIIDFFRIHNGKEGNAGGDFEVKPAGVVLSPMPLLLAVDGDGFLGAEAEDNYKWAVTFDGFGGKTIKLGKVDSSCRPRLQMTSRGEFLVLTCLGSDDHIKISSYGMDGRETWEEVVGDVGSPAFTFAPMAARFAMSRTSMVEGPGSAAAPALGPMARIGPGPEAPKLVPKQEVRVYQNASGNLLLKAECRPVFKTAENFDLSPDGMLAAVVRDGAIAVYRLPGLGKVDLDDMAEVEKFAPAIVSTGNVVLTRLTKPEKAAMAAESAAASTAAATSAAAAALIAPPVPNGPRKPPSLLNPGEKPQFGGGNEAPN